MTLMISTSYYSKSPFSHLEINIGKNYTHAGLDRVLLILEALVDDLEMPVIFKLHPMIEEDFKKDLTTLDWPLHYYNIQEHIK